MAKFHGLISWTEATTATALAMGDGGAVGKGKDHRNEVKLGIQPSNLRESQVTCKTILDSKMAPSFYENG